MIFTAKIAISLETKEYFTHNLVIWRIFVWSFSTFLFGHLVHFHISSPPLRHPQVAIGRY